MGSIKRSPDITRAILGNYEKISKADLIEVCLSFAQRIYGEDSPAEDLMAKIEAERDLLKSQR